MPNISTELLLVICSIIALGGIALTIVLLRMRNRALKSEEPKVAPEAILTKETPPPSAPFTPTRLEELPTPPADIEKSWIEKLKDGLSKTRNQISGGIFSLLGSTQSFDESTLERIHEVLYRSDLGVETADEIILQLRNEYVSRKQTPTWAEIADVMQHTIQKIMASSEREPISPKAPPLVILVIGVNGVGKTTSIGKLASYYSRQGKSVLLCAADTYRAAAIEQLQVWGDRLGVPVIKHQQGADPAAVAYDAVKAAIGRKIDVLLVDTAGRLHNKQELMDELAKVKRVIGRDCPDAPHETLLVIDATTGQNAFQQVRMFQELINVSGLIVTKLDGTAKGGVIVGISKKFQLPVRFIGVGEKSTDLEEFRIADFAASLFNNTREDSAPARQPSHIEPMIR